MTQDRIQYFEKVLSKPIAEPFKSWLEELFNEAKAKQDGNKPAKAKGHHAPATAPVIDTPENTDA